MSKIIIKRMSTVKRKAKPPLQLPETVVLAINTHGYIVLDKNTHKPELFTPDKDIEIVKIAAVVPGVCNILSPTTVTKNIRLVSKLTKEFCKDKNINDVDLEELGHSINEALKPNQDDFPEIEKSVRKSIARGEAVDTVYADHVHASDKGFQIKNFTNEPMINKWYMRSNSDTKQKSHDWKMAIVNLTGSKIDFMPYVSRYLRSGEPTTNIKTIIDTLITQFGVKRLLVVDFSCSNFTDIERGDILDKTRDMNAEQRTLLKGELFGGRTKHNKTKSSKTKSSKTKHNKTKSSKTQ